MQNLNLIILLVVNLNKLIIITATATTNVPENLDTLRLVQVIVRHGDRAPIHPYPNDPYKNQSQYWPNGWTELTQIGLQQHLILGQYLRSRYDGFLPIKYSHFDFIAYSSDVDRAIQSAEANLAGLYKIQGSLITKKKDKDVEWQAVPIHTLPEKSDIWINDKAICPKYIELMDNVYLNDERIAQVNSENMDFILDIAEKSGVQGATTATQLFQVQDALRCENFHNLSLPQWATPTVLSKLDYFKALSFKWKLSTPLMQRLRAGPMIGELLNNFRTHSSLPDGTKRDDESPFQDQRPFRKMIFYSGHDSTLSGIMTTWNIFDDHIPPYAAALIMELRKINSEDYVEIYYKNTSGAPYELNIPECGSPCLLSKLVEISAPYIPVDWDEECQSDLSSPLLKSPSLKSQSTDSSEDYYGAFMMGFAGGASLVSALLGATLLTNAYLKRSLTPAMSATGSSINRYETFS